MEEIKLTSLLEGNTVTKVDCDSHSIVLTMASGDVISITGGSDTRSDAPEDDIYLDVTVAKVTVYSVSLK